MQGRYPPHDWELRDPRFEELGSEDEEDEEDEQGVILDPRARRGGFMSDELYFDGYDVGRDRYSRRGGMYDSYRDDFDPRELAYRDEEGMAYQAAVREKEEFLIESALARIARARAKGKRNVNLSAEEMEALERRRDQQPEPPQPPLASPPPTPAKSATKGKAGSKSTSSTNLPGKARKRNSGLFGSSQSPAKSNSKAKVSRKGSDERALTYPAHPEAGGMMLQGPNGVPIYASTAYYGPPSPEHARSRASSKSASRSTSTRSRRESTPPDRMDMYPQYAPRYSHPPANMRPESAGSNRSLPDDADWYPPAPAPRHRSTSNVQYTGYHTDYDAHPASPAAQSRRNISGPPDVRYASLRRAPPPISALVARPLPPQHASHSDPAMSAARKGSGLSREIGGSSSSSSSTDDESDDGEHVEILPDERRAPGYTVSRAALPAPTPVPVSGNEGRKRRTGRR